MVALATVTTYPETAAPPLSTGAVHDTVVEAFWNDEPTTPVGAPGTVAGVTGDEGSEAVDEPIALEATTVNVYAVPLVRPVIVHDNSVVAHTVAPEPLETAYPVIGVPPVEAGANQDTVTDAFPRTPTTLLGAEGAVASDPARIGVETVAAEEPTPLVTTTANR